MRDPGYNCSMETLLDLATEMLADGTPRWYGLRDGAGVITPIDGAVFAYDPDTTLVDAGAIPLIDLIPRDAFLCAA